MVAAAAAAGCVFSWLWVMTPAPKVQLRCLYVTNNVVFGYPEGVFELKNGTSHSISTSGGPFESGGWRWTYLWTSDAFQLHLFLSPGGVRTFRLCVPEKGGPYRLVLCYSREPSRPPFAANLRLRLEDLLYSTISHKLRWRLEGDYFVQSQPFTVSDGPPIRNEDIPVVGVPRH